MKCACWTVILLAAAALAIAPAATHDTIADSLTHGKVNIDLRYRYEWVDQDNFADNANANTLRLRLGYTTELYYNFFGVAEFQGNWSLSTEDYNSTENGKTGLPVVADPQDGNFSRLLLGYRLLEKTDFKLGRQGINLDNQRFIGTVAWRQLEQTYDAFSVRSRQFDNFSLFYAYLGDVVRVFGEHNPDPLLAQSDQDSHLLNASWDSGVGELVGYGYLLDFEETPTVSTESLGVRFTGSHDFDGWKIVYGAEYADQSPYADGDSGNDARYGFAEFGAGWKYVLLKLGYDLLGGDGGYGFKTPLATLHKFNGWADKFLVTPDDGLEDLYISVSGTAAGFKLAAIYHDFDADEGGGAYGEELDLSVSRTWKKRYTVGMKYADYDGDPAARGPVSIDVQKFWLWLQFKI